MGAQANAKRGQRIGGSTGIEIGRGNHRPAHHGVEIKRRTVAGHELVVDALLTQPDVERVVEKRLLVPDFPQPGCGIGRDAADRLQIAEVVLAEAAPADLQPADVQQPASPAEGFFGVHLNGQRGECIVGDALSKPAGDVAEPLLDVVELQCDSVACELRADASRIAQQRVAMGQVCEKTALRRGRGRGRCRLRLRDSNADANEPTHRDCAADPTNQAVR